MEKTLPSNLKQHTQNKTLEANIKTLVLNKLLCSGKLGPQTTIINELTINKHSRRVDLALLEKNSFTAFEIKSEGDSLERLIGQTTSYLQYFDKVIVVVASKHVDKVLKMVPLNVAVWEVKNNSLVVLRRGRKKKISEARSYIELMKVSELSKLASKLNISIKDKHRTSIVEHLQNASIKTLREHAFLNISKRFRLSSQRFYHEIQCRNITVKDIELLSRFKTQKKALLSKHKERRAAWSSFKKKTKKDLYQDTHEQ